MGFRVKDAMGVSASEDGYLLGQRVRWRNLVFFGSWSDKCARLGGRCLVDADGMKKERERLYGGK